MPKAITKYKCEFCKKSWASKYRTIKHEKECYHNPEIKSCSTCVHGQNVRLDSSNVCAITGKEIYVKGKPIIDCDCHVELDWEYEE